MAKDAVAALCVASAALLLLLGYHSAIVERFMVPRVSATASGTLSTSTTRITRSDNAGSFIPARLQKEVQPSSASRSSAVEPVGVTGMIMVISAAVIGTILGFAAFARRSGGQVAAGVALASGLSLAAVNPSAAATDPAPALFAKSCAVCHPGGDNIIIPGRTLSRTAMEEYLEGGYSKAAIENQIRNGKSPMPVFKGVLTDEEITTLRDYVYAQSQGEWADVE